MAEYTWKQRVYSYAHLVNEKGESLCNRVKNGGVWFDAKPELGKCADCLKAGGDSKCYCPEHGPEEKVKHND